jgi:hypothetical protein
MHDVLENISLQAFDTDWQRPSRSFQRRAGITDEMKSRHPEISWQKVAAIGNVMRHNYENIAAPVIWKLNRSTGVGEGLPH